MRKLRGRTEGNVHIALEDLRDVRAGDMHPLRELGLREAERLHLQKDLAEEGRDDMVDCFGHRGIVQIVRLFRLFDCGSG